MRPASLRAVPAPATISSSSGASRAAHIRRATIDDHAALVALENAVFAIERMRARQWRRHLESLSAQVLVATRERRVVGAAVLFFRRSHRIARLYSIAVARDERGKGTGETLLAAAERAVRKRGSRRLRLEVRRDNPRAQRLYERHGYRRIGVRIGYYEDGHDALRYEKMLDQ